jgi:GT2 family glycosyltransferase
VTGSGQLPRGGEETSSLLARIEELSRQIDALRRELGERDRVLAEKEWVLAEREEALAESRQRIVELQNELKEGWTSLERIRAGTGYRVTQGLVRRVNRVAPWGTRRRSLLMAPARALGMLIGEGVGPFLRHILKPWVWIPRLWQRVLPAAGRLAPAERYELWLRLGVLSRPRLRAARREARFFRYRPLISVAMPTHNTEPAWLRAAVRSLRRQVYGNWELCIADDASTRPETRVILRRLERRNRRIRVTYLDRNRGIGGASNAAVAMAKGEFLALLDHDDELKPNALFEMVKALNDQPDLDFIYSDEDKKTPSGGVVEPFFKPDWSPELLLAANYVTHLSVYRKEVLDQVGGFREGYDGSQDYDLALRVTEVTDRIAHVPLPLYSWRQVPGSAARSTQAKPFAYEAAKRALADALARRGLEGEVTDGHHWGYYRVRLAISGSPRVSVVVPTRDRVDVLRRCLESIEQRTAYPHLELIVVDNDNRSPEARAFLSSLDARVLRFPLEFNFSRIVNLAAREAEGDVLLILHDDVQVLDPEWIEAMLEHAQRPEIAAVGPRLLFPDGTSQHEGFVVGSDDGLAHSVARGRYFGLDRCVHNVAAVDAACLMTRTEMFRDLGGFEERFVCAFHDVDFCLRAGEKGRRVVYTPYASVRHEQAANAKLWDRQRGADAILFRERWRGFHDPYYNPNLDLEELYTLRLEPLTARGE